MLIVLLGGALFLWRSDQEEQLKLALSPEESPLLFPNIQPSDLTKLTVEGPPPGFVLSHLVGPVLSPAAGTLKFELPVNTELDPEKGSAYLRSLLSLRALNTVEGEELTKDSGVYGLNPPTLTVTATLKIAASALNATGKSPEKNLEDNPAENLEQTHAQTLEFGKAHPFSGRRYLRLRGSEKILLVEEALFGLTVFESLHPKGLLEVLR